MGKIVLQRLELRSPLTVPGQGRRPLDSQSQVDPSEHSRTRPTTTGPYLNNRYNNRGILKTNTLQPQPQRVYTRSSSERPTNGYDTDTGIINYNYRNGGYRNHGSHANIVNNNNYGLDGADSDMESLPQFRINSPQDTHHGSRYEVNGYDTDSGLVNRNISGRRSLEPRLMNRNVDTGTPYGQPIQINRISASNSNLNENTASRLQNVQRSSVDSARRIPVQLVSGNESDVDKSAFQSIKHNENSLNANKITSNGMNGSQVIKTSLSNIPNGLSSDNIRDARATPSRIDSTVIR